MTRKQRIQQAVKNGKSELEAVQAEFPNADVQYIEWYITRVLPNKPKKKTSREKRPDTKFNYAENVVKREAAGG